MAVLYKPSMMVQEAAKERGFPKFSEDYGLLEQQGSGDRDELPEARWINVRNEHWKSTDRSKAKITGK